MLPINDILSHTDINKNLNFFEKSQWWTPKQLEEYQNKKLLQLIKHAYENVPYYHYLFKSLSLKPEDIKTKDDLIKLPILSKEIIRKNWNLFISGNAEKKDLIIASTSGSSGNVFKYVVNRKVLSAQRANGLRTWRYAGYEIGDKMATLGGTSLLPQNINIYKKFAFKAFRDLLLSSYNLDSEKLKTFATKIEKYKPDFIRGYPSSISNLANYLIENNKNNIKLIAAMTTSETLTKKDRRIIGEAFDCDIIDQCGCYDGGESLCECKEHCGYHIAVERSIHEFLDENHEPISGCKVGNIILTDLWNYSMPFIRYDAGDMALTTDESCACGRGLPLVKSIIGRTIEQIILPNGDSIPGIVFSDIFEKKEIADKIMDYQIIQEYFDKFDIFIVQNKGYNEEISRKIANFLEGHMGIHLDIRFKFVDHIPRTKANKRKFIISRLKHN